MPVSHGIGALIAVILASPPYIYKQFPVCVATVATFDAVNALRQLAILDKLDPIHRGGRGVFDGFAGRFHCFILESASRDAPEPPRWRIGAQG